MALKLTTPLPPFPKRSDVKPFLRGHFHQAAFFTALGACAMLIAAAGTPHERFCAIVFSLSLLTLYGVSSLYHRADWKPRVRAWMRRFDHGAIFLMIAGSCTPICLLGMPEPQGKHLLFTVWGIAIFGIIKCLFWTRAPRLLSVSLYLIAGWVAIPYMPTMASSLGHLSLSLLLTGGIFYTVGALIYSFKKPNPFPRIFGYHEVFHCLVIMASILHFIVVYRLVVA